uniref:Potassium voltage-gated channel modifier subfamily F member 1 n=1 Tax=Eptatretus burgeri TaxID=7764 RepID=A0A8C4PZE7_EPTBU
MGHPAQVPSTRSMVSPGSDEQPGVTLNIGGQRFTLDGHLLRRFPETRPAHLARCTSTCPEISRSLCDDFDPQSGEFYFDRDPLVFRTIAMLFFEGEIHMGRGVCPICFKSELDFWHVDASFLDDCCRSSFSEKERELSEIAHRVELALADKARAGESMTVRGRKVLWQLMESPDSSFLARLIAIVSFLLVVVSSVVLCLSTIPELQVPDEDGLPGEHPTLSVVETVCICWFTLEYVLRFTAAPRKVRFILAFMNIVDALAIVPYYMGLALSYLGKRSSSTSSLSNVQQAVQALRIMRVARILKLARHSSGLQMLTYALRGSFKELSLLLLYLAMGIFLFSALGYTFEQSHPQTLFTSIPHAFWWAIITMTTVGYGDIYPQTYLGKMNAAVSFLCGILAIALPIHPIINNFVKYYNKQKVLETAVKHRLDRLALEEHVQGFAQQRWSDLRLRAEETQNIKIRTFYLKCYITNKNV